FARLHTSSRLPIFILQSVLMLDRKSTRLNSSHMSISYAVFCLKKKKEDRGQMEKWFCLAAYGLALCRYYAEHGVGHIFFFFNDTATPEIYPFSQPDALPI